MAVNLRLDNTTERHETELGRIHEWLEAMRWLGALDLDRYPQCLLLAGEQRVPNTAVLVEQLEEAYQTSPPEDEHANNIIDRLLDLLGNGRPDETLTIE